MRRVAGLRPLKLAFGQGEMESASPWERRRPARCRPKLTAFAALATRRNARWYTYNSARRGIAGATRAPRSALELTPVQQSRIAPSDSRGLHAAALGGAMTKRWITVAILAAATLAVAGARPNPASAGANDSCADFSGPDCGFDMGDAFCLDATGAPDPLQDCIFVNGSCTCQPRVCCKCENADASPAITACNELPCTENGLGLVFCVLACVLAEQTLDTDCKLDIVNQAKCADDSCVTTGCCTFAFESQQQRTVAENICVETDAATCGLLDPVTVFVAGGSCVGGLTGTCASPTPTATATATATATITSTATATSTATQTPTVTQTPTNTLVPNGGDCVTPGQCASMFCEQGVCCDRPCEEPLETCNNPDNRGTCSPVAAPVPACPRPAW